MTDARFKSEKNKSGTSKSHRTAQIMVLLFMALTVAFLAFLGKDVLNIGGENKEILTSEYIFSGEISLEDLRLNSKETQQLDALKKKYGGLFKHVVVNAELYTTDKKSAAAPDTPLIFWLEIKARNGKVLKPMRVKTLRSDFIKKLGKAVGNEQESLAVARQREAKTKKNVGAVHGN